MFIEFSNSSLTLRIFSGVKGLVSHGDQLHQLLEKLHPEIILVTIPQSQVEGLKEFLKSPFEMSLSDYEIIYGIRLHKYGEVMTPPPIYIEAVQYAMSNSVQIHGIDLDDEKFNETYTKNVKTVALIRHSLRKRRIINYDFHDSNPYEFAEGWIKRINRIKAFERLDRERLEAMDEEILNFINNNFVSNHLIVVDHEFLSGIRENLLRKGFKVVNTEE
jgi:hypothetical protein